MRIQTPARLHLGFIDPFGKFGRAYGSIGVAINFPSWIIDVDESSDLVVEGGTSEVSEKIRRIVDKAEEILGRRISLHVRILSSIPLHKGLGSGTQLSLAISEAILKISGFPYDREDVVKLSGRGKRSGIGISAYFDGGFVLDVGKRVGRDDYPLTLFRLDFPRDWLFLVVLPEVDLNVHGDLEEEKLKNIRDVNVFEISYLILMGLLPSLIERDIKLFGNYLTLIQRKVGEMFAPSQGGIFAHEICERLVSFMLKEGAYGAGQSSWGPVVYCLVEDGEQAAKLKREVDAFMLSNNIRGRSWLTSASPRGREMS